MEKDNCSSSTYYLLNKGQARNLPTIDILNESMEKIQNKSQQDRLIEAKEFQIEESKDYERSHSQSNEFSQVVDVKVGNIIEKKQDSTNFRESLKI